MKQLKIMKLLKHQNIIIYNMKDENIPFEVFDSK